MRPILDAAATAAANPVVVVMLLMLMPTMPAMPLMPEFVYVGEGVFCVTACDSLA